MSTFSQNTDKFAAIYALALIEDDVNTLRMLDCVGDYLDRKKVSFYYGTLARTPLHAEQAKEKIMFMESYIHGLRWKTFIRNVFHPSVTDTSPMFNVRYSNHRR